MHVSTTGDAPLALDADVRSGTIEAIKWLGVALMLLEHWFRFVVGALPDAVYYLGRLVFPLFVFALALALRAASWPTVRRVLLRLFVFATVAQAARLLLAAPPADLNVIFTFGLGVLVVHALACAPRVWAVLLVLGATALVAPFCEFGLIGVAFVASCVMLARTRRPSLPQYIFAGVAFVGLAVPNQSYFALVAAPVAIAIYYTGLHVPRIRGFFYWLYAGQWPVLAVASRVLS